MADKFVKVDNTSTDPVPNIQLGSELGGVTKIKSQNSTFNRTLTLPDKDGVLATLADAQGSSTALLSAGCTVVPAFTNNGDGTFTVGPGNANIFDNADGAGGLANYNVTGGTFAPTDLTNNYLVYNYNGGSPIPQLLQTAASINETTIIPVFTIYRQGNSLTWLNWDQLGYALSNKLHQSIVKTERFRRQTGLGLSEIATRVVSISAGIVWIGAISIDIPAFNSTTNTMIQATRTAGAWVYTTVNQYNNTQYDDGTNTIALSGSTFAVNFVYRVVQDGISRAIIVLGNSNATLEQAIDMQPPSTLPPEVFSAGMLVGRIIVARAASTATRIDSAFNQFWGSGSGGGTGVTDHNSLNGIQGGTHGEYYHLTSAKFTFANGMDQQVSTTANPTFNTTLVSNGGAGKTTITRAASASSYTFTLPAASGTAALTSDLSAYALKAGDTIGGVVIGDKTQHGSLAYDAGTGLTIRAKTGSTNDLTITSANGSVTLLANPTGGSSITTGGIWTFSNLTGSNAINSGCATFGGGIGVGENVFAGGYVHANNVRVTGGGTGATTITRASGAANYTATLPAKDGTIAMLSDISGGGGGTSIHNDLTGLQGGTTAEYYHLTFAQHGYASTLDQILNTTANPTFNTLLVSAGGTGKTTLTRTSSVTDYTATFPAKTGTVAFTSDLTIAGITGLQTALDAKANLTGATFTGTCAFNAGGQSLSIGAGTADHAYIGFFPRTTSPATRLAYVGFPGAGSNTFEINNSSGNVDVNCASLRVNSSAVWTESTFNPALKANLASPTFTGTATFSVINATSTITGNTVAVNAGGAGSTTITRASSASNYTATLPAKTGTIAFLDDISGGGSSNYQRVTITSSQSVTAPSWANNARLLLVGGGGGGAGGAILGEGIPGGGGGGGAIVHRLVAVTPGASYAVAIGAGGAGGSVDANGAAGGSTTFGGTLAQARGGGGCPVGENVGGEYGAPGFWRQTVMAGSPSASPGWGRGGGVAASAGIASQSGGGAYGAGGSPGQVSSTVSGAGGGGSWGSGADGGIGSSGLPALANTGGGGGGGGGGGFSYYSGGSGGSGLCLVEWLP